MRNSVHPHTIELIGKMKADGVTCRLIARHLELPYGTVHRYFITFPANIYRRNVVERTPEFIEAMREAKLAGKTMKEFKRERGINSFSSKLDALWASFEPRRHYVRRPVAHLVAYEEYKES